MVKREIKLETLPMGQEHPRVKDEERKQLLQFQEKCLLAKIPSNFPTLYFAKIFYPSTGVDADFFEVVIHDPERVDLIVGDVGGKGQEGLILALHLKESIPKENLYTDADRLLKKELPTPLEIVELIEQKGAEELNEQGSLAYLTYLRLDLSKRKFFLLTRGSPPILHQRKSGELFTLQTEHPPLPSPVRVKDKEEEGELAAGDRLFIFSDGILALVNSRGEPFDIERIAAVVEEGRKHSFEELLLEIDNRLKQFIQPEICNDLLFIGVEVLSEGAAIERIEKIEEGNISFEEIFKIEQEIQTWLVGVKNFKWTPKDLFQLKLATHELTLELLKMLKEKGIDTTIKVEKTELENGVTLTFVYQGPPFHPQGIKNHSDFGFALAVIQKNVQSIKYGEREGGLSFVELTKLHS